jgi:hypothetical protein
MCALCRIDMDGQTLCPACFERLSHEGALESARVSFKDYGRIGTTSAIAGLLLSPFALAFGFASVYYGVRALRLKRSMGESDGVVAAVLVVLAGVVEAIGGGVFVYFIVTGLTRS